jgi:hypothetical protein
MAQRAKAAVAKANGASAATDAATGGQVGSKTASASATKASTAPAAPALPAAALKTLPKDVAAALRARKILVLGVIANKGNAWRPMADDDVAVRRALKQVNRYHGDVFVKRVSLPEIAGYGPLLANLQVNQTPSVVVIDRDLQGTTIAGYLDLTAINQAIVDARRASTPQLIESDFLHKVNHACAQSAMLFTRFPLPADRIERKTFAKRLFALAAKQRRMFTEVKAPARWKALQARILRDLDRDNAIAHKMLRDAKAHDWASFIADYQSIDFNELRGLDRKLDSVGATACVWDRRS